MYDEEDDDESDEVRKEKVIRSNHREHDCDREEEAGSYGKMEQSEGTSNSSKIEENQNQG